MTSSATLSNLLPPKIRKLLKKWQHNISYMEVVCILRKTVCKMSHQSVPTKTGNSVRRTVNIGVTRNTDVRERERQ